MRRQPLAQQCAARLAQAGILPDDPAVLEWVAWNTHMRARAMANPPPMRNAAGFQVYEPQPELS